jgi:hypothetical protein
MSCKTIAVHRHCKIICKLTCFTYHNIARSTGVAVTPATKYLSLPPAATLALRHSYSVLPTNGIGIWFFYPQRGVVMIFWTKRLTSKEKFLINHTM